MDATAHLAARTVYASFRAFLEKFDAITRRAGARFAERDWIGGATDARERLDLYNLVLDAALAALRELIGERFGDDGLWSAVKRQYLFEISEEPNPELAETFYNSVTRRVFHTVGVNAEIEFVSLEPSVHPREPGTGVIERYEGGAPTATLIARILDDFRSDAPFADLDGDARLVADRVEAYLGSILGSPRIDAVEMARPVFFRNKAAYLVGRVRSGTHLVPLVVPLVHPDGGVRVDAVLNNEAEVSILFSFTRSYFHVETASPRELIAFLKSILPLKPVAELYISLGYNRHGKTELYRNLRRHMTQSDERFQIAAGDRGMVMLVFTLPFYDFVFKVIRDCFDFPKSATRDHVLDRYRMVFVRDRVGRLVEAQEFEHLKFRRAMFAPDLLDELLAGASQTTRLEGESVDLGHVYTERKVTPLNLYLREAGPEAARRAVVDYGNAIKELAAANIFPGDFLLKNFGVTRHGRVVFYDYDELCLLTDCRFRRIPPARRDEDELSDEVWFAVAENDVFPEEFRRFLGLAGDLREVFERHHADLFTVEFWSEMSDRHRRGEIMDFFPYPEVRRLRPERGRAGE